MQMRAEMQCIENCVRVYVYCPVSPRPKLPTSLYPALEQPLPPVIYHVSCASLPKCVESQTLIDFLAAHTDLSTSLLEELTAFGALYARVGVPTPHERPRPPRIRDTTNGPKLHNTQPFYARIYASPRRHRAAAPLRRLYEDADLLVVDKPAGIPVAPGADNVVECVTALTDARVTHRLDICTCGVLALARHSKAARDINSALMDAKKVYRVLTRARPPVGRLVHWYNARAIRGRGILRQRLLALWSSNPPNDGWVRAELFVEKVCKVEQGWECTVRLITGRTHQIRMQFAAVGCAVWGDEKYTLVNGRLLDTNLDELELGPDPRVVGLCAVELQFTWCDLIRRFTAKPWWARERDESLDIQ